MDIYVRGVRLGAGGVPAVCASITAGVWDDILVSCRDIAAEQADVIEWRADFYNDWNDVNKVKGLLSELRMTTGNIPLIFTYRTIADGGEASRNNSRYIDHEEYLELLMNVAETHCADIIDMELGMLRHDDPGSEHEHGLEAGPADNDGYITRLAGHGCRVLISKHFFDNTPADDEMEEVFDIMHRAHADIMKLAVMPRNRHDVIRLLTATDKAVMKYSEPVVTMSMGKLGVASRVIGQTSGSAMTFGCIGEASAPGQLPVSELRKLIATLG